MTDSTPLSWSALAGSLSLDKPNKSLDQPSKKHVRVRRRISRPPAVPRELLAGGDSISEHASDEQDLERVLLKAPPWLLSTVLHMSALILMGITWYAIEQQAPPMVAVMLPAVELPGDEFGKAPGDRSQDGFASGDDRPFGPPDVVHEGFQELSPTVELSPLALPSVELSPEGFMRATPSRGPDPGGGFIGRGPRKKRIGQLEGNTPATIKGVNDALEWFKRNQRADGLWSLKGPYADGAYEEDLPAATALALLAFQGDGHTHVEGDYKEVVKKGWKALLKLQAPSGQFMGAGVPSQHQLYAHAQCTIAVCELHGMSHDSAFRRAAERAIGFCIRAQDPKLGGWRYEPATDSDLSVTGWFLMALASARMAGLEVPQVVFDKAAKFLDRVQAAEGSQYTYIVNDRPSLAMTAEGLLSRQYLGWKRNDVRLIQGANFLVNNPISMNAGERDVYYWYYATQVMHHLGGEHWRRWNNVMKVEVPKAQVKDGREKGSWDPGTYRWGDTGGRLFVTALQTYMLQVYYRHLPLYREMGGKADVTP